MKVRLNNITTIGDNIDVPGYSALTATMENYFSFGLKITIKQHAYPLMTDFQSIFNK